MEFKIIYGRSGCGKTTYIFNEIKEKIQDYNFRKHALKQINKFEKETGMDYLSYQEKKFDEVIEEACKNKDI